MQYVWPSLFALFVWWFGTALVFLLNQLPRHTYRRTMVGATVVLGAALLCVLTLADRTTAASAYAGFACGVLVWAWQEIAFLTGVVTGPNRAPLPEGAVGWQRFRSAVATIIHNEIAMLALGLVLLAMLWDAPNQTALWTYVSLWVMRQSAKFNIFLGARNLGEAMLPPHLAHLGSYFRRRNMNWLFPFSVTGGTVVTVVLALNAVDATDPYAVAAYSLLAALVALAVIEHWFLMMPLPLDGLWTWGRPSSAPSAASQRDQRSKTASVPLQR